MCLAAVDYMKIIDCRTLGRLIQVNGAFYSIKKSRVINRYILVTELQISLMILKTKDNKNKMQIVRNKEICIKSVSKSKNI